MFERIRNDFKLDVKHSLHYKSCISKCAHKRGLQPRHAMECSKTNLQFFTRSSDKPQRTAVQNLLEASLRIHISILCTSVNHRCYKISCCYGRGDKSAPSNEQSHLPCAEFAWETMALRLFILSTYLPVLFPTTIICIFICKKAVVMSGIASCS